MIGQFKLCEQVFKTLMKLVHAKAEEEIARATAEIERRDGIIQTQKEAVASKSGQIAEAEDTIRLAQKRIVDLETEIAKIHDEWKSHEMMLNSSATQLKSQLDAVQSGAQTEISQKQQAISELQRERMSFSQMVEESNRHVHQLKQVNTIISNPTIIFLVGNFLCSNST